MAANRERAPLDRYDTPRSAVNVLLRELPELRGRRLFDPCSGNGQMAQAVAKGRFAEVITNDIDPTTPSANHYDLRRRFVWESVRPDWTVTNPPFCWAGECWNLAMDYSRKGVALLVRLSFLEVCKGGERFALHPPDRVIVMPRMKFDGKGADKVTCAWLVWLFSSAQESAIRCVGKQALVESEAAA